MTKDSSTMEDPRPRLSGDENGNWQSTLGAAQGIVKRQLTS